MNRNKPGYLIKVIDLLLKLTVVLIIVMLAA